MVALGTGDSVKRMFGSSVSNKPLGSRGAILPRKTIGGARERGLLDVVDGEKERGRQNESFGIRSQHVVRTCPDTEIGATDIGVERTSIIKTF